MNEDMIAADVPPHLRTRVMGTLSERLGAVADVSAESVESEHLVSGYLPDDPLLRHRFMVKLEHAFAIPIDGNRFDSARTVGELADLIAQKIMVRKGVGSSGRTYHVCYRTASGRLVETRVVAPNHNRAIEMLRAEGLVDVVSVEREEEDSDSDRRAGRVRNGWTGFLLPIALALLVGGAYVAFIWWRKG